MDSLYTNENNSALHIAVDLEDKLITNTANSIDFYPSVIISRLISPRPLSSLYRREYEKNGAIIVYTRTSANLDKLSGYHTKEVPNGSGEYLPDEYKGNINNSKLCLCRKRTSDIESTKEKNALNLDGWLYTTYFYDTKSANYTSSNYENGNIPSIFFLDDSQFNEDYLLEITPNEFDLINPDLSAYTTGSYPESAESPNFKYYNIWRAHIPGVYTNITQEYGSYGINMYDNSITKWLFNHVNYYSINDFSFNFGSSTYIDPTAAQNNDFYIFTNGYNIKNTASWAGVSQIRYINNGVFNTSGNLCLCPKCKTWDNRPFAPIDEHGYLSGLNNVSSSNKFFGFQQYTQVYSASGYYYGYNGSIRS